MESKVPEKCAIHAEKLDKMETYTEKMDKIMFGNGNPENGLLLKVEKVMDYMLDAKERRLRTDKFRRGVIVTFIVLALGFIPAIISYGTLVAEVEHNKTEITEIKYEI